MQKGFKFDLNYCTGCQACTIACIIENNLPYQKSWRRIFTFNERHYPRLPLFHLSMACNHCIDPACLKYCPALAYNKNDETGAVTINTDLCIGCKYCSWVCPYDAPKFNDRLGIMEKCTFCNTRLEKNLKPACVSLCPTGALDLIDFTNSPAEFEIPGFTQSELKPAIKLIPLSAEQQMPESSISPIKDSYIKLLTAARENTENKISLKIEWTLAAFTLIASILAAWFASAVITENNINPYLFTAIGSAALGLTTIHLGKRTLAYRAILNWKNSWLSREIIFYTGFLLMSIIYFSTGNKYEILGWLSVLTAFLCLFSIDKLYQVIPRTKPVKVHSAEVTLTGIFLTGVFIGNVAAFTFIGLFKAALYIYRKINSGRTNAGSVFTIIIRLALTYIIPCLLFLIDFTGLLTWGIISIIAGEIIDRIEFYSELEIVTPQKQIMLDLKSRLEY